MVPSDDSPREAGGTGRDPDGVPDAPDGGKPHDGSGAPRQDTTCATDGGRSATPGETEGRTPAGHHTGTAYLAGALGGLVGAAAFGGVMWLVNPEFLRSSIPALYGLEPRGVFGWSVHLLHGAVLGLVFGAIVSLDLTREALAPTDPDQLGPGGVGTRLVAAGVAFGITVWAVIPVLTLPALTRVADEERFGVLSVAGTESLAGHAVFGLLLGVVYALIVSRW